MKLWYKIRNVYIYFVCYNLDIIKSLFVYTLIYLFSVRLIMFFVIYIYIVIDFYFGGSFWLFIPESYFIHIFSIMPEDTISDTSYHAMVNQNGDVSFDKCLSTCEHTDSNVNSSVSLSHLGHNLNDTINFVEDYPKACDNIVNTSSLHNSLFVGPPTPKCFDDISSHNSSMFVGPPTPKPMHDTSSFESGYETSMVVGPATPNTSLYEFQNESTQIGEIGCFTSTSTQIGIIESQDLAENNVGWGVKEVVVPSTGMLDKIIFGFESKGSKLRKVYVKYHDVSKRKFFWTVWEKNRGSYGSYKEFKESWDSNTKIWKTIRQDIKRDLKSEFRNFLDAKDDKRLDTGARVMISDLLREQNPFNRPSINNRNRYKR